MRKAITILLLSLSTMIAVQGKPTQGWLDQKFSMFIHFGLYSEYGGVYNGVPVRRGYSEQIQSFAGIFSDWYAATADSFNPMEWDADGIVALAKEAGMRSIVFTAKHHDGFCMYHSQYTQFNIVDATSYGKDLMKELSDACQRGGIGFAVYYSLIDWHFPQAYPISSHNADPITPEHFEYNMNQVREIMTNYGDISEIWFDMGSLTLKQSQLLYELVNELQPECMISGRLGNDYVDFCVMADNEYPDYKIGVPWQTAASMFDETWGYRSWQERGSVADKVDEKIKSLIKVISRGGNYLLNIGPKGDGSIVQFESEVLREIGRWTSINSEAIYGTTANPFHEVYSWGDITAKENALYLFIEEVPTSGEITLSGFQGEISNVKVLSDQESCPFIQTSKGVKIKLPVFDGARVEVLKVSFRDGYSISPSNILHNEEFAHHNAQHTYGHSSLDYYCGYKSLVGYDWHFMTRRKSITPVIHFTENERGARISITIDGNEQDIYLEGDSSEREYLKHNSVKWGSLYTKRGRGVFGYLAEEGRMISDEEIRDGWTKVEDFIYGERHEMKLGTRGSMLLLQEIESKKEQAIAIELGSGNAVYVLLNGKYITAHFSPKRTAWQKEILLLPLKKGNNQLVIKYFNRFENHLSYSLMPLESWVVYRQRLTPVELGDLQTHKVSLGIANPASKVAPLRLNNVFIRLQ